MTAPRNPVRRIVAVMAAALVCAGATVVGGATASAVPVSADRTVTASSSSGPSNCGRWQNNPGTTKYTTDRDALVRSQHRVCHLSSGVRIKHFRAQLCNLRASGKAKFRADLVRDGETIYDGTEQRWPSAGHCKAYPTSGIRAADNHQFKVSVLVFYTGKLFPDHPVTPSWRA